MPHIAVVGGGIGGLSTALALRRVGIEASVYEQQADLAEVGAGIGLWRGAVRALQQLELPGWFWDLSRCTFRWAETAAPDGRVLVGFDISDLSTDAPCFVARRADLLAGLADALGPEAVTLGARLTGVTQQNDGVELRFADGRVAAADLVVGADGVRSAVRECLHGDRPPRYSGETCYRGMASFPVDDPGMLREVQGSGLRCAVHPLDPEQVYWWAAVRSPAGIEESPNQRKATLQERYAGWHFGFPEALAATPAESILKNDLFDRPPLRPWSVGRVTLLGDAAHPTTPNLGLGGCMAIEDALVLARAFHEHGADHVSAFAQYESQRRRRTARVVRTSARFGRLGSLRSPTLVRARELALRLTPTRASRALFVREVGFDPGMLQSPAQ